MRCIRCALHDATAETAPVSQHPSPLLTPAGHSHSRSWPKAVYCWPLSAIPLAGQGLNHPAAGHAKRTALACSVCFSMRDMPAIAAAQLFEAFIVDHSCSEAHDTGNNVQLRVRAASHSLHEGVLHMYPRHRPSMNNEPSRNVIHPWSSIGIASISACMQKASGPRCMVSCSSLQ
jgi:hypothetical protein